MCALPSLDDLACEYGTDKSTRTWLPPPKDGYPSRPPHGHGYSIFYEHYFEARRPEPIRLLEIGVLDGRSLATWKAYFGRGQIYGIDIDPTCQRFAGDGMTIFTGSQADAAFLGSVRAHVPDGFDIIIDDGSHYVRHITASFAELFGHLTAGGIYVIEDLHVATARDWGTVAWNRGMALLREDVGNDPHEMIQFLKSVRTRADVAALTVHLKKICFIEKTTPGLQRARCERGDSLDELYPPPAGLIVRARQKIGALLGPLQQRR
jgi:hypothetical protein